MLLSLIKKEQPKKSNIWWPSACVFSGVKGDHKWKPPKFTPYKLELFIAKLSI